ncbi:MAG: sugar phosphate isomerase/epimerase, partial [Acidobacteria bacterium]|nr:sugar phosphate isomerase/epimerase [Acidobacteriota bacterium]
MTRRQFTAAFAAATQSARPASRFIKSICSVNFPPSMPLAGRFAEARNAGFDAIEIRMGGEIPVDSTPDQLKQVADAAQKAGVTIASLWVSEPLSSNPLNHPDPEVRAKGVEALKKAIDFATHLRCGALLIVPGRLGSGARFQHSYQDTWDRVTAELRKCIPFAERAQVLLTPENVWNKFLVSPLEMRAFVDQFHSPWLQSHFDMGNVMQFGYPQDWILTLGARIKRVHVKDYKLSARAEQGRFVELFEGDVDFKEVMAALVKVGYSGTL